MSHHIAIDARIISSSTGRYVERLLTHLQDIDTTNRYTVLVPTKDKEYWQPHNKNFTVKTIDFPNYSLAEQTGFKRYLDQLAPDLVHFCMPQQPVAYAGKKVTTFHDLTLLKTYNSDKNWLMYHVKQLIGRHIFAHVARSSDQLIAISQYTKDDLLKLVDIPAEKVSLIYEASDVPVAVSEPLTLPSKQFILYVGSQSDYKNIKRLGDAHQLLLDKHPDLWLVLAGKKNASARMNEAYFARKGYKNIHFTDFIPDAQLAWLYSHTAAYVFASLMEGFGLPGLEAMGYGAPVASSDATCLPEINGPAAHYFNPRDTDDIARVIDDILTDKKLRARLVSAGYKQIKKYSWEKQARETHKIYMKVLEP